MKRTTWPNGHVDCEIALTLRQFVGVLQELTGTNPDTLGHVVASFNNARIFHKWAVA